jgi:hypothetical protein
MGYQYPGEDAAPYNNVSFSNAMMSNTSLSAPYNNLNTSGSPLASGSNGDVGANSETAYGDLWSDNTYLGNWTFQAYTQAADCPVGWTGTALEWGGSDNACSGLSVPQWQSYWQQDAASAYDPIVVSLGNLSANQEIYGPAQAVTAYEDTGTAGGITSHLQVNSANVGSAITSAPYDFSLNTLPYQDGSYTVTITGTDSGSNTDSDSASVYVSNGDLTLAGHVNLSDLAILAANWGKSGQTYAQGNITGQSTINLSDLAVLAANWGWSD